MTTTTTPFRRTSLSAVAVGLMAAPVILMPTMASAIPDDGLGCGTATPGATLIAAGICEVVFTESGTFTAPSGISKLAAFLVAGGDGGGIDTDDFFGMSYGGGAGEVLYIDDVEFSAPLAVAVGTGGNAGDMGTATETTVGDASARPGAGSWSGNENNNPSEPYCDFPESGSRMSGGGAGAAANGDNHVGGAGYLLSDFPGVDTTLFPANNSELVYGQGGSSCLDVLPTVVANSGNGGATTYGTANDGSDGVVIFRFAPPTEVVAPVTEPTDTPIAAVALAKTGPAAESTLAVGAASALFAAGAALLVMVRRSRKNA